MAETGAPAGVRAHPGGIALSVASCTVKQYFDDNGKIDCELTAFKVLARRVKKRFPHLGICAVGDALYACQPVMRICEDYGWKYVLTFKKGIAMQLGKPPATTGGRGGALPSPSSPRLRVIHPSTQLDAMKRVPPPHL